MGDQFAADALVEYFKQYRKPHLLHLRVNPIVIYDTDTKVVSVRDSNTKESHPPIELVENLKATNPWHWENKCCKEYFPPLKRPVDAAVARAREIIESNRLAYPSLDKRIEVLVSELEKELATICI